MSAGDLIIKLYSSSEQLPRRSACGKSKKRCVVALSAVCARTEIGLWFATPGEMDGWRIRIFVLPMSQFVQHFKTSVRYVRIRRVGLTALIAAR